MAPPKTGLPAHRISRRHKIALYQQKELHTLPVVVIEVRARHSICTNCRPIVTRTAALSEPRDASLHGRGSGWVGELRDGRYDRVERGGDDGFRVDFCDDDYFGLLCG